MVTLAQPFRQVGLRFLVAKYVPDMRRMEPRNIGVVVWHNGVLQAKFLGEQDNRIATPPSFSTDTHAYREWIGYWRRQASKDELCASSGARIRRDSPDFLDALAECSKKQFLLVDGGEVLADIDATEAKDALQELFETLVKEKKDAPDPLHRLASLALTRERSAVFENTRLAERPDFTTPFRWICEIKDSHQNFEFDYALYPGRPEMLMSNLHPWNSQEAQSLAFRFQAMQTWHKVERSKCAAFVYATDELLEEQSTRESLSLMRSVGSVVNFADPGAANLLLSLVG